MKKRDITINVFRTFMSGQQLYAIHYEDKYFINYYGRQYTTIKEINEDIESYLKKHSIDINRVKVKYRFI